MKKSLLGMLVLCAVVSFAPRVYAAVPVDLKMEGFVIALPNGVNLNVSQYSEVKQFVVNYDNVEFTMPGYAAFTLTSDDGYYLANNAGAFVECNTTYSRLHVENHPGIPDIVVRVTPSNPKCSYYGGGIRSYMSDGGSVHTPVGGGGAPGSITLPSTTGTTETTGILATTIGSTTSLPIYVHVSPRILRTLSVGSTGEDVRRLQALLNADPDTRVATSGAGAPGRETGSFLWATRAALIRFQQKWGLSALGVLDSSTRNKLNNIFVWSRPAPTGTTIRAATPSPRASVKTALTPSRIGTTTATTTPSASPVTKVRWWQFWRWFR